MIITDPNAGPASASILAARPPPTTALLPQPDRSGAIAVSVVDEAGLAPGGALDTPVNRNSYAVIDMENSGILKSFRASWWVLRRCNSWPGNPRREPFGSPWLGRPARGLLRGQRMGLRRPTRLEPPSPTDYPKRDFPLEVTFSF